MKSQSVVTDLRRKVFAAVARVAYESENVEGDLEEIPFLITPDETPRYRESIYRERQIASERVRLAMGLSLRPANKPVHITAGVDKSTIASRRLCRLFLRRATSVPTTNIMFPTSAATAYRMRA